MEIHLVGEGWGSRDWGVGERWSLGGAVAHGTLRVGERGARRTLACRLLEEQLQEESSTTVTRLESLNRLQPEQNSASP